MSHTLMVGEDVSEFNPRSAAYYSEHDYASTAYPLNDRQWYFDPAEDPDRCKDGCPAFRSSHTGGVNFLFGDNVVKLLDDSTDLVVLRALSTRNGGDTVESQE